MIDEEKKRLLHRLKELERNFEEGRISQRNYKILKKEYQRELDAIEAAEKIKRMQGQSTVEKPLDHWVEKAKKEKEIREKEELMKKYIRESPKMEKVKSRSTISIVGMILLLVAFFIGSGFGVYFLNLKNSEPGVVFVNESAFPTFTVNQTSPIYTCQTAYYSESTYPTSKSQYRPSSVSTPSSSKSSSSSQPSQSAPSTSPKTSTSTGSPQ